MSADYYTVRKLGRLFGLSRSTLLYYDEIGLLQPAFRTGTGYRMYGKREKSRLERITTYRKAGLSLEAITEILDGQGRKLTTILEHRLSDLNREIGSLRLQQRVILDLLRAGKKRSDSNIMNKAGWTSIMRAAGMNDEDMFNWHQAFEQQDPRGHHDFLVSLGIHDEEIRHIREWSLMTWSQVRDKTVN